MGGVGGSQPPAKARRERARKRFTLALQKYAQNACKARPLTRGLRGGTSSVLSYARSLCSLRHSPLASLFCEASKTARAPCAKLTSPLLLLIALARLAFFSKFMLPLCGSNLSPDSQKTTI